MTHSELGFQLQRELVFTHLGMLCAADGDEFHVLARISGRPEPRFSTAKHPILPVDASPSTVAGLTITNARLQSGPVSAQRYYQNIRSKTVS